MTKPIEIIKNDNKRVEIFYDEYLDSPRDWDNLGIMICFHQKYNLGDKHSYDSTDYNGWDDIEKAITRDENAAVILPLYLYDHSGITIKTTPFSCRWDSGQIGFIYTSKKNVRKEFEVKHITTKIREKVKEILLGEVKTYDQYLNGDVYYYDYYVDDNLVDGCGGYFGIDYIMEEARNILEIKKAA